MIFVIIGARGPDFKEFAQEGRRHSCDGFRGKLFQRTINKQTEVVLVGTRLKRDVKQVSRLCQFAVSFVNRVV